MLYQKRGVLPVPLLAAIIAILIHGSQSFQLRPSHSLRRWICRSHRLNHAHATGDSTPACGTNGQVESKRNSIQRRTHYPRVGRAVGHIAPLRAKRVTSTNAQTGSTAASTSAGEASRPSSREASTTPKHRQEGSPPDQQAKQKSEDSLDERQRRFTNSMVQLSKTHRWRAVPVLIAEAGRVGLPLNVICVNAAMSVYARNGRWYEALDLLHKMREQQSLRNVRNIGSSRVGTSEEAEEASAHKDEAERMKQRPQTLPLPDTITYNVAIRACGRGKRWKPAVQLLDQMVQDGLFPDGFSFTAAISACHKCGEWEVALDLIDNMSQQGLPRNKHALNAAAAACGVAGRWRPALEILEQMKAEGPLPDVFTYSSVIEGFARGGMVDMALQTLEDMRSATASAPEPNTVCYNIALRGLSREGRWQEARKLLTEVATSTEGAAQGGRVLDYLSYNAVIRACAAAGEVKEAFQTREEMRKAGIAADPVTYEALLEVAAVAGDWQSAEAVIRELLASCDGGGGKDPVQKESGSGSRRAREEGNEEGDQEGVNSGGMKADSRSVFVKVTHKEGKERGAASAGAAQNGTDVAAHAGAEAGVDLGADTFASPGDWTERRKRWRRQQLASGVQATPQVFQLLMEAYSRAGEWERALACLDDMWSSAHAHMAPRRERGFSAGAEFPPDATCFGWAIQACASSGQWERALAVFSSMASEGIRPSKLCYESALLACAQGREGARAVSILSDMMAVAAEAEQGKQDARNQGNSQAQQPGHQGDIWRSRVFGPPVDHPVPKLSATSFKVAMEACRRGGDPREALSVLARMKLEGYTPDLACLNEALEACVVGGERWERALALLEEMQSLGIAPDKQSYSAVLRACESSSSTIGNHEVAEAANSILSTMLSLSSTGSAESPFAPDARDFLATLRTCAASGHSSMALSLLTQAKEAAVADAAAAAERPTPPEPETSENAARSTQAGTESSAAAAAAAAMAFGFIGIEHYHAAITACGRGQGNVKEEILALMSEMKEASGCDKAGVATYAVVSQALAEAGEWEWCLVLLEELEELFNAGVMIPAAASSEQTTGDTGGVPAEGQPSPKESLTRLGDALAAPVSRQEDDVLATYAAAIRACSRGLSGKQPILAVLERMRWEDVEVDERTYMEALKGIRACSMPPRDVTKEGEAAGGVGGVWKAKEIARALIEWEAERSSGVASPVLYSAAIKVCSEEKEIAAAKELFVEARKSPGLSAAARRVASATEAGSQRSDRARKGLAATYCAALEMCVAAGDGRLARDVLRWMRLEGFPASEASYMRAIEASCNPLLPPEEVPPTGAKKSRPRFSLSSSDDLRSTNIQALSPDPPSAPSSAVTSPSARATVQLWKAGGSLTATTEREAGNGVQQREERGKISDSSQKSQASVPAAESQEKVASDEKEAVASWIPVPGGREFPPEHFGGWSGDGENIPVPTVVPSQGLGELSADESDSGSSREETRSASVSPSESSGFSTEPSLTHVPTTEDALSMKPEEMAEDGEGVKGLKAGESDEDAKENINTAASSTSGNRATGPNGHDRSSPDEGLGDENDVDWHSALSVLSDMQAAGLDPPAEAFEAVLGACGKAGRAAEGLEVAYLMNIAGMRPSAAIVAQLTLDHAEELEREQREIEKEMRRPPEDWVPDEVVEAMGIKRDVE